MKKSLSDHVSKAVTKLIEGICYDPVESDLRVRYNNDRRTIHLSYSVSMSDIGLLVGTDGRTIKAIRYIAQEIGEAIDRRVVIDVKENYRGVRENREFEPAERSADQCLEVLSPLARLAFGEDVEIDCVAEPNDRFQCAGTRVEIAADPDQVGLVQAFNDAFYPFGLRQGRPVLIRAKDRAIKATANLYAK